MLNQTYTIPQLPPDFETDSPKILKAAAKAHRFLGELKGKSAAIPNQGILIDTLSLQEAHASSIIENIITTQDEIFEAQMQPINEQSPNAKEVSRYRSALRKGFELVAEKQGLITNNIIIEIFQILKTTNERFRATPGTALKHDITGETVYVPPQDHSQILKHMAELEIFINTDAADAIDPLVKLAIIHHQFESIHPFSDGNGRVGRILNVLYLTQAGLLDIPILYHSRAITDTKSEYYSLLQKVRDQGDWESWIVYMLEVVETTAKDTIIIIEKLRELMAACKVILREQHPKIYSQDLINNIFRHPYTKVEFLQNDLQVSRQTAAKYLNELADAGLLRKRTSWRTNYYVNAPLVGLFLNVAEITEPGPNPVNQTPHP